MSWDEVAERLGWWPARPVVARGPVRRLLGMIPASYAHEVDRRLVMVFPRCASVHTHFMGRELDIAFCSREGAVLERHERVPPGRVLACWGAYAVLERFS